MSNPEMISVSKAEYNRLRDLDIEYGGFISGVRVMKDDAQREPETASQRRERIRMQALVEAIQCRGLVDTQTGDDVLALARKFGDFLDGEAQ